MVMAKDKKTPPLPVKRGNGHEANPGARLAPRGLESHNPIAHSPVRYLPWLVLTLVLHAWLFVFPLPEGDDRAAKVEEGKRRLMANLLQLEAIQQEMENQEVPTGEATEVPTPPEEEEKVPEQTDPPAEEKPEEQPKEEEVPPVEEPAEVPETRSEEKPEEEAEAPETSTETETPETTMPDRTERKAVEGEESKEPITTGEEGSEGEETKEESNVGEEPVSGEEPAPTAAETARASVKAILDEPLKQRGHFQVAYSKWEAQAARRLGESVRGAEGSEDGMPQVEWEIPEDPAVLLSSLDLFGGEIFLQNDAQTWWHMERNGEHFEPRFVTREEVLEIARRRGLNISYAKGLDPVALPAGLLEARRRAVADERYVSDYPERSFVCLGTTREQSFVSERAQTFLRRNKSRFPQYAYWEDAKSIMYRYLVDANDVVYDVEVTNLK